VKELNIEKCAIIPQVAPRDDSSKKAGPQLPDQAKEEKVHFSHLR
jgi:hypothetical protein